MAARGGAAALKKRGVVGEQGEIVWICAARPTVPACTDASFVKELTGYRLRTPFILPILWPVA